MTPEELDHLKWVLKRLHDVEKELWLEKQLLRNLIIDSGWMDEQDLDAGLEQAKARPENIRQVQEHHAGSEQLLAEIGLSDWLADFDRNYPKSE